MAFSGSYLACPTTPPAARHLTAPPVVIVISFPNLDTHGVGTPAKMDGQAVFKVSRFSFHCYHGLEVLHHFREVSY